MGKRRASGAARAKKAKAEAAEPTHASGKRDMSEEAVSGLLDQVKQDLDAIKTAALQGTGGDEETAARLKSFGARVTGIKILARKLAVGVVESAEKAKTAKQQMEDTHLQLQNVLYEHLHILNEIKKCQSYRSRAEDLELVTKEQYLASNTAEEPQDTHHEMLGRLQYEAEERARLKSDLEERQYRKKAIANINEKKRGMLRAAPDVVSSLLDACDKCTTVFGAASMPHDELLVKFKQSHPAASHLPAPLHTLLMAVGGYNIAHEARSWTVSVTGDVKAVDKFTADVEACETYMYALARTESGDGAQRRSTGSAEDEDDDEDDEDEEDEGQGQGSVKRVGSSHQAPEEKKLKEPDNLEKTLFASHPLAVELRSTPVAAEALHLVFRYYPLLKVVTTTEQSPKTQLSVLHHVSPEDGSGQYTAPPQPVLFLLDRLGVENFRTRLTGSVFACVLAMTGLAVTAPDDARHTTTRTLHAIRQRFKHLSDLQADINTLKSREMPAVKEAFDTFPITGTAVLKKVVVETPKDPHLLRRIKMTFARDDVELEAVAAIPGHYPSEGVAFTLSFTKPPKDIRSLTVSTGAMAAEASRWVDFEGKRGRMLAYQTRRLQMCLDLLVELQESIRSNRPSQWCKAIYNGPEHSLPFRWDPHARLFVLPHSL